MQTFQAINPKTNALLPGDFVEASPASIDQVVSKAAAAFDVYRKKSKEEIAQFLEQIATEIEQLGDELIERCHLETALPHGRLQGERGRTCNQLRLFAQVVREGSWVGARIDTAQPDRQPFPKADIRQMSQPLGPVAVFGASNFPLAFSTAGGDTASALAAGCPVVVKGHPAHPGTTALVAKAIQQAIVKTGMPEGTFSIVQGTSFAIGQQLVKHPAIQAVGFTGSYRGGTAIWAYANERPQPIPVFAEMGSTNPVFILPGALRERATALAEGLAASVNLGVGQFCTNPGLVFVPAQQEQKFQQQLTESITAVQPSTMLTAGIQSAYAKGTDELADKDFVQSLASGQAVEAVNEAQSVVFQTTMTDYLAHGELQEEVFGPSSVLVAYEGKADLLKAAEQLHGHLTATLQATEQDLAEHQELISMLEKKVGRLIINGFPTGVEVCHSMVHGGPYPATTAPQSTSVGSNAVQRFVRPVCYQGFPDSLLPPALQQDNPLQIWRLVDGEMKK